MKKINDLIFKAVYYASLIFVLIYLYRIDFLSFNIKIQSKSAFLCALTANIILIFYAPYCLKLALNSITKQADFKKAFISSGITVFTKYLPGKILMLYSLSHHVSNQSNKILHNLVPITNLQLISVWSGLLFGIIAIVNAPFNNLLKINSYIFVALCLLFFFSRKFQSVICKIVKRFFKKDLSSHLSNSSRTNAVLLFYVLIFWLITGLGFVFLCGAFSSHWSYNLIFVMPVARSIGMIAFFTPGGLGITESIVTVMMVYYGYDLPFSITMSVMSRILNILTDVLMYIIAFSWNHFSKNKNAG